MGNLYGSEYWTYQLPKRVSMEKAKEIMTNRLPLGTVEALEAGLIDKAFGDDIASFQGELEKQAKKLAKNENLKVLLAEKNKKRTEHEAAKPLEKYREEEIEQMKLNFYGFDPSYHVARYNFVFKVPHSRTPLYLARHRSK